MPYKYTSIIYLHIILSNTINVLFKYFAGRLHLIFLHNTYKGIKMYFNDIVKNQHLC